MADDDRFRRYTIFPKAFAPDSQTIDPDLLLRFVEEKRDHVWAMSLSSAPEMPDIAEAHAHGCRAAEKANAEFERRNNRPPDDNERAYYLGFYEIYRKPITSYVLQHLNVALYPEPEDGNYAHYTFMLYSKADDPGSIKKRKNDMRDIRNYLALFLMGPDRHICEVAQSRASLLENITVTEFPERPLADLIGAPFQGPGA